MNDHDLNLHDRARDLARDLDLAIARDRDLARARDLVSCLDEAAVRTAEIVQRLEVSDSTNERDVGAGEAVLAPARVVVGLVARVTRVLPVGERVRYREEFDAELHDVAQAGVSRRAELAYALRVSVRVWSLRRALRAPSPAGERTR